MERRLLFVRIFSLCSLILVGATACTIAGNLQAPAAITIITSHHKNGAISSTIPTEVSNVGERLFLETRFAQYYFAHAQGKANAEPLLGGGDPIMATLQTPNGDIPSPFAGKSMNCRQCHLVDDAVGTPKVPELGYRTYNDFAVRSPVPNIGDGQLTTPRHSPLMINLALNKHAASELYHYDGQFETLEDLVRASYTGRNFGWQLGQEKTAIRHIASIIRGDNGKCELALADGGSYTQVFVGKANNPDFVLPPEYQLDVRTATDEQIFDHIAQLVAIYIDSLVLSQDHRGVFNGSPYDAFLQKNQLPAKPATGESNLTYSRRLRVALKRLTNPQFITAQDGKFLQSKQPYRFGAEELTGLKTFLREPQGQAVTRQELSQGKIGNCLACHAAPNFTDFRLHGTGVAQAEYDNIHGDGAFQELAIPDFQTREANYNAYLPGTSQHPQARGVFRQPATASNPKFTDLGAWNVYLNPDFGVNPAKIEAAMGLTNIVANQRPQLLPSTIALFKTPGLRDLGDSEPYFHNGSQGQLEDVISFYQVFAAKARTGEVRNADPELSRIVLTKADVLPLTAFLSSLKEDYPGE